MQQSGDDWPIRKVKIEVVEMADTSRTPSFSGIIKEVGAVRLAFRVAGRIQQIRLRKEPVCNRVS